MWQRAQELQPSNYTDSISFPYRKVYRGLNKKNTNWFSPDFPYLLRHAFATLSFIAEIFLFLYVGMVALDIEKWEFASDRSVKFTSHL